MTLQIEMRDISIASRERERGRKREGQRKYLKYHIVVFLNPSSLNGARTEFERMIERYVT